MDEAPVYAFTATTSGPPKRTFHINSASYSENGVPQNRLLCIFQVDEHKDDGTVEIIRDTVELRFDQILRYPPLFTTEVLNWYDENGNPADFDAIRIALGDE